MKSKQSEGGNGFKPLGLSEPVFRGICRLGFRNPTRKFSKKEIQLGGIQHVFDEFISKHLPTIHNKIKPIY